MNVTLVLIAHRVECRECETPLELTTRAYKLYTPYDSRRVSYSYYHVECWGQRSDRLFTLLEVRAKDRKQRRHTPEESYKRQIISSRVSALRWDYEVRQLRGQGTEDLEEEYHRLMVEMDKLGGVPPTWSDNLTRQVRRGNRAQR